MNKLFLFTLVLLATYITRGQTKMELTEKQLVKTKIINQSVDTVWWRWTTHEGLKTFFGADNKIVLTPNGAFEIYFMLDKPTGLKGSEGCKVLSYLPKKMFSFSWNAPPQFEEVRKSDYKTWVVVEFNYISENRTEVTLHHVGWPTDERWTPVFDYFNKAWDFVLNSLSAHDVKVQSEKHNTTKVTGIGGIFFKCKDPNKMKEWYKTHLGLDTDKYGTNFEWRQGEDSTKYGFTQWSPFGEKTTYFEPSTKEYMINYRVKNLEQLVQQLKKDGVTLTDKIETYDYGKFVHILDIEGNKIELWEPNDVEYNKIVSGRTK